MKIFSTLKCLKIKLSISVKNKQFRIGIKNHNKMVYFKNSCQVLMFKYNILKFNFVN